MPRKRSFRLSEIQAEVAEIALTFFIVKNEANIEWAAHIRAAKTLLDKLLNYKWEAEENEKLDS